MKLKSCVLSVLLVLLLAIPGLADRGGALKPSELQILSEGFEGAVFPPTGWSVINSGDSLAGKTWEQTWANWNSGAYSAFPHWGYPGEFQEEWLITRSLDLTGSPYWRLSFYQDCWIWQAASHPCYVRVSTAPNPLDTTAYDIVWTLDPSGACPTWDQGPVVVSLSAYAGSNPVWIAWEYQGLEGHLWFIDDVVVDVSPNIDVMAHSIDSPPYIIHGDTSLSPQVTVRNVGSSHQSFGVVCRIDSLNGPQVFYDTDAVSNLPPDSSAQCTFNLWQAGGEGAIYQVTAYTVLAGDMDPSNDTTTALTVPFDLGTVISSPYYSIPPTIDGMISAGEWSYAPRRDISDVLNVGGDGPFLPGSAYLYAMNDDDNLYLAVDGVIDDTCENFDLVDLYFDDNHDHSYPPWPDRTEGEHLLFEHSGGDTVRYTPITGDSGMLGSFDVFLSAVAAPTSGHMQYELALPFGAMPHYLSTSPGDTIGLWLYVWNRQRPAIYGCWPTEADFGGMDPTQFGDIILGLVFHDCGVVSIDSPPDTAFCDSTYTPTVTVRNFGGVTETFDVRCTIVPSEPLYIDTQQVAGLGPGAQGQVSFMNWTIPSDDSMTYMMACSTMCRGDADSTNDSMQKEIFAYTGVQEDEALEMLPSVFALQQNVPNPFYRETHIRFQMPVAVHTTLTVHDVSGRLVRTLVEEAREPGHYSVIWDGRDSSGKRVSSGIYFYRLSASGGEAGEFAQVKKLIILK